MTTRITLKDGTEWDTAHIEQAGISLWNRVSGRIKRLSIHEYCDQWKSGVINALPESREEYEED